MARLGDICQLINGDRSKNYPSQSDINNLGDVPFINAGHLADGNIDFSEMNYISYEKYNRLSSGKIQDNDILYCLRGSLGKKAIVKNIPKGAIASSLVIIRPNPEKIESEFLFYALESPTVQEQMARANNGSSQPNLSAKSVSEYTFFLPDINRQHKVISKISAVNSLITLRKQQLAQLDELVKVRFVEMFGGCSDRKRLEEYSALITKGASPKWQGFDYCNEGTLFVTSENVREGYVDLSKRKYLPNEINHILPRSVLQRNDILVNIVGASIGRAAIFESDELANINQAVAVVRIKEEELDLRFLITFLNSEEAQKAYGFMKKGGARDNLSLQNISDLLIPVTTMERQKQFAAFSSQIDKSKTTVQQGLGKLETLKSALMHEYFG